MNKSGGIRTHDQRDFLVYAFNPFLTRFEPLKSYLIYLLYIYLVGFEPMTT